MANPTGTLAPLAIGPAPRARRWPLALVFVLSLVLAERLYRAGGADLVGVSRALSLVLVTVTAAWVVFALRGLGD
ncbi:MAG: hypothetical protein V9G19_00910 [Tetrasphaera sp.]